MTSPHAPTALMDRPCLWKSASGTWMVTLPECRPLPAISWEAGCRAIAEWLKAQRETGLERVRF